MTLIARLALAAALAAPSVALSQQGGGGTGGDGCYFNDPSCTPGATVPAPAPPPPAQTTPAPPTAYTPPAAYPPPTDPGVLACVTPIGPCAMPFELPVGSGCSCYVAGIEVASGVIQSVPDATFAQQAAATTCLTDYGACPLAAPVAPWNVCTCPTVYGPAYGITQ